MEYVNDATVKIILWALLFYAIRALKAHAVNAPLLFLLLAKNVTKLVNFSTNF